MDNYAPATAISTVTSSRLPASPRGVAVEGRRVAGGTAMPMSGIHTPAFLKDVSSGVRAWRPPV